MNNSISSAIRYFLVNRLGYATISFPGLFAVILAALVFTNIHDENDFKVLYLKAVQGSAVAQAEVGLCYAVGYHIDRDIKEAASWWERAAEQWVRNAMDSLKKMSEKRNSLNQSSDSNENRHHSHYCETDVIEAV
ncbi:MAG: SEL1-like repeat protein [Thermoguttaceae bacterium]|nr:SEL1-like repeat protein [Thermoguttaceae bacterium]